jgi:hypothetical protein
MVEATPPTWKDTCERCGDGFAHGEPRWIEQRRYTVHTRCAVDCPWLARHSLNTSSVKLEL